MLSDLRADAPPPERDQDEPRGQKKQRAEQPRPDRRGGARSANPTRGSGSNRRA